MVLEGGWHLGIGVVLAWAALPWLVKLARRSRFALPAEYYRALLAALCIATALIFVPLVRSGVAACVSVLFAKMSHPREAQPAFVVELMSPLVRTAASAWPSHVLAPAFAAIGGVWLLLLAAGVCLSLAGYLRLRQAYGQAAAAPSRVRARAQRIAAELGITSPPIRIADVALTAFTYGVVSPVIVLSSSTCDMPDEDLDFVLRHELCHVARHDTRIMFLIDFAQRCFAGHPSLRPLASEIRVAREARADQAAAGTRSLEYARFLLTMAERIDSVRAPSSSLVSMADTALERRVEMLIDRNIPLRRRSLLWLALAGMTFCSFVFLTPASLGQAGSKASDRPIVRGNLSVEQVETGLFTNTQPMLDCYAALPAPRANVSLHVSFEIDERGRVSSGRVSAPDHPELEPCLHTALMQRSFPRPSSGVVSVDAQMLLTPPYGERRAVLEAKEGTSHELDKASIRASVNRYMPQLRDCFERVDDRWPSAKISMNFIIGRDGKTLDGEAVDKSDAAADSDAVAQLAKCVNDTRRTMIFPAPADGVVTVNYPLIFERKAD